MVIVIFATTPAFFFSSILPILFAPAVVDFPNFARHIFFVKLIKIPTSWRRSDRPPRLCQPLITDLDWPSGNYSLRSFLDRLARNGRGRTRGRTRGRHWPR